MSQPLEIPKRVSSLMPKKRLDSLTHQKDRSVSAASRLSEMSVSSNVSDFLDAKVAAMEADLDWIRCFRDGLDEVKARQLIDDGEFAAEIQPLLDSFRDTSQNLTILKRQQRLIEDDLEEELQVKKKRTAEQPDDGLLERAYASTMVARVMAASAKQKKAKAFDQTQFRKDVVQYYNARDPDGETSTWCHVLGMFLPSAEVKAAHLVPKSLSGDEISFLFGAGEAVLSDCRNGITLAATLERRLDEGTIAIVPSPGAITVPTRWMCVLLDETKAKETVWAGPYTPGGPKRTIVRLEDIDKKELRFLGDHRPARRYLFFRFVISYLHAKASGNTVVSEKVNRKDFWPTIGRYLHKSTLVTLARCVSGTELPPSLVEGKTFESEGEGDQATGKDIGMLLGADLRDALVSSMREEGEENTDDEED
ncbi:hypothetical protein BJX61DRAFT_536488 [Aspergillus egyptiacus]|nr:hypothetical protein BJX61DRAFT_536488 [Aspergillus egyptiacus]